MPAVSAPDIALLESEYHNSLVRLSFLVPPILWEARINDGSIVKGETSITFDGGNGSFFSMIEALQEVWVGSALQGDDVGRLRIKSISSGDGGVTGTLTVAGHSHQLQDDQYLTFKHDYPLKPRRSFIERVDPDTEIWYMDDDIVYTNENTQPPPVVIAGPHRAGFLSSGSFSINVDASGSYAQAGTITGYGLTVASTAGTPTVNFNSGTGLGDITFTAAGYYWAKYTVTDSNAHSQVSYRLYFVHDPDRAADSYPFIDCAQVTLENEWETGGWMAGVTADDKATLPELPDHTLCVIWGEAFYNDTESQITFLPDNATTLFAGYVRGDEDSQDWATSVGQVDFTLSTIEGVLRNLHAFSTSLIAHQGTAGTWYQGKQAQKMRDIIHNLWRWRTTLYEVCDVLWETNDTLLRVYGGLDEGNPYDMANVFLYDEGIRSRVLCDQGGRIHIVEDQQLMIDADRGSLTTIMPISSLPGVADFGGPMVIPRKPEFDVPYVTSNGIYWDGSYTDGKPEGQDFCSIAPGGKPLWRGDSPVDKPAQTISSQNHLNQITGRFEAKINNPIEEVRIELHGNYLGVLDCAYGEQFTMDLQASQNPRGISWSDKPLYLRNVMAVYSGETGFWDVNCAFEPEHITTDGVYTECPSFPALGGNLPVIPPAAAVPGALLTGASVNYKSALGDLWTKRITQGVRDLIADPFWRTRQGTTSPSSAITWRCGVGYIRRSTDGFLTTDVNVTPSTNPPNDAGDSPAPTNTTVTYEMIDGSYITQSEFVCMANWTESGGDRRCWLVHTDDDGSTWTWKSIGSTGTSIGSFASSTDVTNPTDDSFPEMDRWGNEAVIDRVARLDENNYVVCYEDDDFQAYVRIVNTSTGPGDRVAVGTQGVDVGDVAITNLGTSTFMIAYLDYHSGSPGEFHYYVRAGSHAGKVITLGTPVELTGYDIGGIRWGFHVERINNLEALVTVGTSVASSGKNDARVASVTLPGLSVSLGVAEEYTTEQVANVHSIVLTSTKQVIVWTVWDAGGTRVLKGRVANIASQTVNMAISSYTLATDDGTFSFPEAGKALSSTKFILSLWRGSDNVYILVGEVGALDAISKGSEVLAHNNAFYRATIDTFNSSTAVICYDDDAVWGFYGKMITVSGLTPTLYSATYFTPEDDDIEPHVIAKSSSEIIVFYITDEDQSPFDRYVRYTTAPVTGGSYDFDGLGLMIGRSTGTKLWLAGGDNTNLTLYEVSVPGLSISNSYDMGSGTWAQMDARTYLVRPFVPFGHDDTVYLFGRMNDPQSLGTEVHIIRTVDGGSSFGLIEDGWSVDHCGALVLTTLGYMYAIRNRAAQAKLYRDNVDNNLIVQYTFSFAAPIAPHGMMVDFFTGIVYACSWLPDDTMVIMLPPPYVLESDLTFNHDNTDGIEAIVLL